MAMFPSALHDHKDTLPFLFPTQCSSDGAAKTLPHTRGISDRLMRSDPGSDQRLLKRGIRYRGGVVPLQKSALF